MKDKQKDLPDDNSWERADTTDPTHSQDGGASARCSCSSCASGDFAATAAYVGLLADMAGEVGRVSERRMDQERRDGEDGEERE
jgi:hypothetical protein